MSDLFVRLSNSWRRRKDNSIFPDSSPPEPFTPIRQALLTSTLVNTTNPNEGFNSTNTGGINSANGSGTITRDATVLYRGSPTIKATHTGYTENLGNTAIVRANWLDPLTATHETDGTVNALAVEGDVRWFGGGYYIRSSDTHTWTGLYRISDFDNVSPKTLVGLILQPTQVSVCIQDYGPGTATGVPDRDGLHATAWPRTNGWVHAEFGVRLSTSDSTDPASPTAGWTELWIDGVQVGSRIYGRTLKVAGHVLKRAQLPMGTYGLGNGTANPATELWCGKPYISTSRRGIPAVT